MEGARDGECVKKRMVGKESTDFNSQNGSGRPSGMEGGGERERGREGRKDVSRYYYHCHKQAWAANPQYCPSLRTSTHIGAHTHTHIHTHTLSLSLSLWCMLLYRCGTETHTCILPVVTITLPSYTFADSCWDAERSPSRNNTSFNTDTTFWCVCVD